MTVATEVDDRITKCQKILDQDPNSQIFAALAEAYRKKGDLDRAFRLCQNGLKVHPSYGPAHVVMAKINLDRRLFDWAEAELRKAIELDGNSRAIELLLAEIYIYKGEFNRAITLLKRLHQSDPTNSQIEKLLQIAVKLPEDQQPSRQQVTKAAKPPRPAPVEPAQPVQPEPQASLSATEVLNAAMRIPELQGGLFINPEGLVVESQWTVQLDPTVCGATFAQQNRALNQELVQASFGNASAMLIENAEYVFYLLHVDNGMFLFAGTTNLNLGNLRMKMAGLIENYEAK
jgi:tetratricopeptide (TPR) repeat protein